MGYAHGTHVPFQNFAKQNFEICLIAFVPLPAGLRTRDYKKGFISTFTAKNRKERGMAKWLDNILERERRAHLAFFGHIFDLSRFRSVLEQYDPDTIGELLGLGLEPHFFPEIQMANDTRFPGWKNRLGKWYNEQVDRGNAFLPGQERGPKTQFDVLWLSGVFSGVTVLIDIRQKPLLEKRQRIFARDNLLGPIIRGLREKGTLVKHPGSHLSSRFGISADEWREFVRPELASFLGVEVGQVRLERYLEASVVPQLYPDTPRGEDVRTNSYVWYEEHVGNETCQISGGGESDPAGFCFVKCSPSDQWWCRAVRPIIILSN
jgi:hypothetical protein